MKKKNKIDLSKVSGGQQADLSKVSAGKKSREKHNFKKWDKLLFNQED